MSAGKSATFFYWTRPDPPASSPTKRTPGWVCTASAGHPRAQVLRQSTKPSHLETVVWRGLCVAYCGCRLLGVGGNTYWARAPVVAVKQVCKSDILTQSWEERKLLSSGMVQLFLKYVDISRGRQFVCQIHMGIVTNLVTIVQVDVLSPVLCCVRS